MSMDVDDDVLPCMSMRIVSSCPLMFMMMISTRLTLPHLADMMLHEMWDDWCCMSMYIKLLWCCMRWWMMNDVAWEMMDEMMLHEMMLHPAGGCIPHHPAGGCICILLTEGLHFFSTGWSVNLLPRGLSGYVEHYSKSWNTIPNLGIRFQILDCLE